MKIAPPPNSGIRDYLDWLIGAMAYVLMESDITFALVVLGISANLWGMIGLIHQSDLQWFAHGFAFEFSPWVWALNHMIVGWCFIHVALRDLPKGRTLLLGWYVITVWTIIMVQRPNSSFSSGVTLNAVFIFMAGLMIQRSGR